MTHASASSSSSVVLEAPIHAMNEIITKHALDKNLLDNEWLHLFAMDAEGKISQRYVGGLEWRPGGCGRNADRRTRELNRVADATYGTASGIVLRDPVGNSTGLPRRPDRPGSSDRNAEEIANMLNSSGTT